MTLAELGVRRGEGVDYVLERGPNDAEARFSPCGLYRYQLHRWITANRSTWRAVVFLMLNPSTADAFKLDPTVRRCVDFATRWGFDRLDVINLFAFRSPHPRDLYARARAAEPIIGPANDSHILAIAARSELVIAAWGNHGELEGRGDVVRELLEREGVELHHLGLTSSGAPKHPLARGRSRIPNDSQPQRWAA